MTRAEHLEPLRVCFVSPLGEVGGSYTVEVSKDGAQLPEKPMEKPLCVGRKVVRCVVGETHLWGIFWGIIG